MIREQRFEKILKILNRKGNIDYAKVAAELKVSEDTIRRDIELLDKNGLLSKVRGGAVAREKNPLSFQERQNYLSAGKDLIAIKAQQFLASGQTVFMDGGTTNCLVAQHFSPSLSIKVITNNIALVPILIMQPKIELVVLGGGYDRFSESTSGIHSCEMASSFVADLYLMGACGLDHKFGITSATANDAALKKKMIAGSKRTIVIGNHEKLEQADQFKVAEFTEVYAVITDLDTKDKRLDSFRGLGSRLI